MTKKLIRRIILISDACLWLLCLIMLIARGLATTDWGTEPLDIYMSKGVFKVFIIFNSVGLLRSIFGFFCFELTGRGAEKNHSALRTLNRALYVAGVVLFDLAVALCLFGPEYAAVAMGLVWAAVLLTNIVLFVIYLILTKRQSKTTD